MQLEQRISAFVDLGSHLLSKNDELDKIIELSTQTNAWFTKENIKKSLQALAQNLKRESLETWTAPYQQHLNTYTSSKTVAMIPAGNIPLVGFHDFLAALICGHKVLIKLSSNDKYLLPYLSQYLTKIEPGFTSYISYTETKLENFDAIIATGSNNSALYFDYYFKNHPHIIRRNRTSVAVLSGNETMDELQSLADDLFQYFGLGCRNVSKLFVPDNYAFDNLLKASEKYFPLANHHKFKNNYDYRKAILQMNLIPFIDMGFCIFKEDASLHSPIAVVHYEHYTDLQDVEFGLKNHTTELQCIVSQNGYLQENSVVFGKAQKPELWDYADQIDTMDFLLKL